MTLSQLVAIARGDEPADLVLTNARLIDVISGSIDLTTIAIAGSLVVGVGGTYRGREAVDLEGRYVCPGFIDALFTDPRCIDFIAVAAYGRTTTATGAVRLLMDLRTDVRGRHVLIVEDIVDTGYTLDYILSLLRPREPASLKTCALLRKPARLKKKLEIDYLGFDVPDLWIVGYGLDFQERHRALPYIRTLPSSRASSPP